MAEALFALSTYRQKRTNFPPPQTLFAALTRGGEVSPVFQKSGILFNIEKGVGQNLLLTRGGGS